MSNQETWFREFARRLGQVGPLNSPSSREKLESDLRPIVRTAMRGNGPAWMVGWVQSRLTPNGPADPLRDVPPLARELCDRLLARLDPLSGRETVVGL